MSVKRTIPVLLSGSSNLKDVDLNKLPFRIPGVRFQVLEQSSSNPCAGPGFGEVVDKAEIVIGDPSAIGPHWYNLPSSVKWIQSTWAGVDLIQRRYINPHRPSPGFIFTRLGSGFGPYIADYILGQIISQERHFHQYVHDQDNKKWVWQDRIYGGYRKLGDLTVGLLGVGSIGQLVAKICKACGMEVCGLVRKDVPVPERSPFVDEYFLMQSLPDLLRQCDYICNTLPSTEATRNLLSGNMLSNCKPMARFINVGRGDIISDASLLEALRLGWIDHAVLDVFDLEPLPRDNPLWENPKVTITPHVAALTMPEMILSVFAENLELYEQGNELKYQVDWNQGY